MLAGIYVDSFGEYRSLVANNMLGAAAPGGVSLPKVGIDVNNSNAAVLNNLIQGSGAPLLGHPAIKDVGQRAIIVGNVIDLPNGDGIASVAGGTDSVYVANNRIDGATNGIWFDVNSDDNMIIGNMITDSSTAIFLDNGSNYNLIANNFLNNMSAAGISLENGGGNHIIGNHIVDIGTYGIFLDDCEVSHVVGNFISVVGIVGIVCFGTIEGSSVVDNCVLFTFDTGIVMEGVEFILNGNIVNNHASRGIDLRTSQDFTAVGNMTMNPDLLGPGPISHGMDITATTGALIGSNRCEGGIDIGAWTFNAVVPGMNTMLGNLGKGGINGPPPGFNPAPGHDPGGMSPTWLGEWVP